MRTRASRRVVRGLGLVVLLLLSLPAAALAASERARTAASADYLGIGRAYQPTMYVDREDRFWPASFLNVLGLTWDNRYTCLNRKGRPKVCGGPGRPLSVGLLPAGGGSKSDYLDYPAGRGDIDDQAKSFAQKVGSPANSRVYFFAGYGQRKTRTIASFQYWYFYNFNYVASSVAFRGYHEGDLEQVAILFRAGKLIRTPNGRVRRKVPKYVFLSQHNKGELLKWSGGSLRRQGLSPVVHAARGTHANYKDCGEHSRGALPRDFSDCDGGKLLDFRRAKLIPVKPKTWACWQGRLGRGGNLPRYGASPRPILQQQKVFDRTPRNICSRYTGASSAGAATASAGAGVRRTAERFDDCRDWERPPSRPGSVLVACDQRLLQRFFRSGLSAPGPERLRLRVPGQAVDYDPPAVLQSSDPTLLSRAAIAADRPVGPDVYAARRGADGTLAEARFPAVPVAPGAETRVDTSGPRWRLVDSRGKLLAERRPKLDRTLTPPQPAALSARRSGSRALVSWRTNGDPSRRTRFYVTSAATRRGLGQSPRIVGRLIRPDAGAHSLVVSLGRARWLSVLAYRDGRELRGSPVWVR